jgi:hypothetical protein
MQPIYHQIRKRARQIILRHPGPDFYHDHSLDYEASRQFFDGDRVIKKLLSFVAATLEDDFGHGLMHAVKVSHDAGTLMVIEARQSGYDEDPLSRLICLAQTAGLLHDIKRKKKDHSSHGAVHAKKMLKEYPFSVEEINHIFAGARIISMIPSGTWYPILTRRSQNLWTAIPREWKKSRVLKPHSEPPPAKNTAPNLSIWAWRSAKSFLT